MRSVTSGGHVADLKARYQACTFGLIGADGPRYTSIRLPLPTAHHRFAGPGADV